MLLVRVAVLQDDINEGSEILKCIARNISNDSFDGGKLLVRTAIINDDVFEGQESPSLAVTRMSCHPPYSEFDGN